jgi:hypothetical protein
MKFLGKKPSSYSENDGSVGVYYHIGGGQAEKFDVFSKDENLNHVKREALASGYRKEYIDNLLSTLEYDSKYEKLYKLSEVSKERKAWALYYTIEALN